MARRSINYLIVGGWNTLFGYSITVFLYYHLSPVLHIITIGALTNLLTISMSFTTYKLFVFKTRGNWVYEYARSYVVYGVAALLSIAGLWILVDLINMTIWIAQGVVMAGVVALSYFGHNHYTFGKRYKPDVVS